MTKILPPPYLPPALLKVMPSLAPPRISRLTEPPHLLNLIHRHGVDHVKGRYVAQRRRIVQTGTADLYYRLTKVALSTGEVHAEILYRGYPVYKNPQLILDGFVLGHTWDFVSRRGRLLHGSQFEKEREAAMREDGVEEMVKHLEPL